jgi:hypothetical protein
VGVAKVVRPTQVEMRQVRSLVRDPFVDAAVVVDGERRPLAAPRVAVTVAWL